MAMSESRRRKLELLARSIAKRDFASASELLRRTGRSGLDRAPAAGADRPPAPMPLAEACAGVEATAATPGGSVPYYLVRRRLADVAPDCVSVAADYAAVLRGARQQFDELAASAALCHAANAQPEDLLFLDTETCGFSGTAIFLVGMMSYAEDGLVFEQCLARDYSEEIAILQAFADRHMQTGVLVTFNGKAFDMSMIRERWAFHGLPRPDRDPPHLDLLHEARKLWRGELPDCKLQTLERVLCGRHRPGDIPGSEIPEAYHRFVATGDARRVGEILHHNLLDLLTMAEVVVAVLTGCGPAMG